MYACTMLHPFSSRFLRVLRDALWENEHHLKVGGVVIVHHATCLKMVLVIVIR